MAAGAEIDPQIYAALLRDGKAVHADKGVNLRVAEIVKGGAKVFGVRDNKVSSDVGWVLDSVLRPDLKE